MGEVKEEGKGRRSKGKRKKENKGKGRRVNKWEIGE